MPRKNRLLNSFLSVILILSLTLMNVNVALADDGATPEPAVTAEPTEEPVQPTAEPTEPPVVPTESPAVDTPVPTEAISSTEQAPVTEEQAPIAELLTQAPENTDLVVLDENGEALSLTSQEALNTILETDPMWCPAGVLPGGTGCTTNFDTISLLIADMTANTGTYDENGIIYFTSTPGESFSLTDSTLGADYATLSSFNLTLQGGWNGSTVAPTFTSQTSFGANTLTIGSLTNPWIGNITLNNFSFSGVSGTNNAVTVYTDSGDITLDNVDVALQSGTGYTAFLDSNSGDILVQNGSTFAGATTGNNRGHGFFANTDSGSITITGTSSENITFNNSRGQNPNNYDGASLSAPTISLAYVTASGNDGNGISITDANLVTLNNVISGPATNGQGNGLSGVLINGTGSTVAIVSGGVFADNGSYGIEILNGSLYVRTTPTCPTTGGTSNGSGCYNVTPLTDTTAPVITATLSGTAGTNGWYRSDVIVSWSVSDPETGVASSSGCTSSTLSSETTGTTLTCSATNNVGLSGSNSVTVKIDKTAPVIAFVSRTPPDANGWNSGDVTVNWSCTDSLSGIVSATVSQMVTTEGTNQSATGTCQDLAGNMSMDTQSGINIDKTAPTAIASVSPAPNVNGWNNTDVTVTFTGTDAGSGIAFCSPAVTVSTEGAGQTSSSGTCTDLVGHVSSPVSATGINIDKTSPVIAFTNRTPAPNANGWNNTDVTINWSCTDSLSGPVSASINQTVSTEGANQSATGTCQDLAGNTASDAQNGINIDKTAPKLNLPADMSVEATSSSGAIVNYSASATDNLDAAPSIVCVPPSGSAFVMGTTMVNCIATDHADNTSFGNFNITVQDTTGPVIEPHVDVTAEASSASGANVTYSSPTTSDDVDGPGVATCTPLSGSLFPIGDTTVTCTASDSNGNAAVPTAFVVHVVDTTAPVVAPHLDVIVEATSAAGATVTYTSPATSDAVDGAGIADCAPASGGTFALGDTTVTCTATDTHGNTATPATFIVHVVDSTAPIIAPHGDVTAEATSAAGANVSYSNPTTSDIVDGAGEATCSPASGELFPLGDTLVTCAATDTHGNTATPTSFMVHVVDTTAPVIAPHANISVAAASPSGTVITYTSPATSDLVDGAGTATCTPSSGTLFPIGNTIVTCNATDSHGNNAIPTTFTVDVIDTAAPVIDGHLDVTVEATSAAGAIATYTSPTTSDVVDGPGVATCAPASGAFFVFGNTTVTCNATDSDGNVAIPSTFVVHVVDTTAPVIAPHTDVTMTTSNTLGAIVSFFSPATSDVVDGVGTASCTPASGSFFVVGDTPVTCNATDANGNAAQPVTFIVHVLYKPNTGTPTPPPAQPPAAEIEQTALSIPVTSGLLDLDCLSVIESGGIKVTFHNLCDYQALLADAPADTLPAQLPAQYSFVQGLNVLVFFEQQVIKALPTGTGVQMDFPIPANTQDQYAVLLWDDEDGDGNGEWLDVTQLILDKDLSKVMSANASDELYQIRPAKTLEAFYRVLTTEKTGTFVLVRK